MCSKRKAEFRDRVVELTVWTQIRSIHQRRFVQQMYFWLLVVPILARLLEKVPPSIAIVFRGQTFTLPMTLPFSWTVFYFAAVCFVLSNAIYQLVCPRLIKDHPSYSHFKSDGKSRDHLEWYNSQLSRPLALDDLTSGYFGTDVIEQKQFWEIHAVSNVTHPIWRLIASMFALIGIGLVIYVALQGLWSVVMLAFAGR